MSVIMYVSQHRTPALIHSMRLVTFFGSSLFFLPAYLVLIVCLLLKKYYKYALMVAAISLCSWLVLSEIKILFHRHRPPSPLVNDITTFSFPSAHAYSSLIFFCLLAFIVKKSQPSSMLKNVLLTFLLACPVVIGLSRIILNVHYTTDVIAGECLGTMWLILTYLIYSKWTITERL